MAAFTPGPRRTTLETFTEPSGHAHQSWQVVADKHQMIAEVYPLEDREDYEDREGEANARLIAAAPELAARLEDFARGLLAHHEEMAAGDIEPCVVCESVGA